MWALLRSAQRLYLAMSAYHTQLKVNGIMTNRQQPQHPISAIVNRLDSCDWGPGDTHSSISAMPQNSQAGLSGKRLRTSDYALRAVHHTSTAGKWGEVRVGRSIDVGCHVDR
jgi:hypothetical protein